MSMGKPVIGTGYSGNMEFMDPANSCVVGYQLIDIKAGEYPFGEGQKWAEPDTDHAVYFMRRVAADSDFRRRIGAAARARLQTEFSSDAVGNTLADELFRLQHKL
jgi:glycosyltransferase involved in cell wall biosynthesis